MRVDFDWHALPGAIDLHAHSNASDGTDAPRALVEEAQRSGLSAVAITDHDTTSGWAEAATAAYELGVVLVPGVEFSSQHEYRSVHILGYLLDEHAPAFLAERERIREERLGRARRMVERIGADYPLTWQHVLDATSEGATVGRPHIADALVALGIVPDRSAAFDGILHWRGGYYQPHRAPEPVHAVRIIREAGGVPVIAHPAARGRAMMEREELVKLVDAGLFGLEVFHRDNPEADREWLMERAQEFDLVATGSSDWHGFGKPNRMGENTTTPAVLERIVAEATGTAPVIPPQLLG